MTMIAPTYSRRIGFLDDDATMRATMQRLSTHADDVQLFSTATPATAIEWVRQQAIDVLIADLNLGDGPDGSGLEVLERANLLLQKSGMAGSIQFILFTTAAANDDARRRLKRIGGKYVEKVPGLKDMLRDDFGFGEDDDSTDAQSSPQPPPAPTELEKVIAEIFAGYLAAIPDQQMRIHSGDSTFTVSELREEVLRVTERGKRYIGAWMRANMTPTKDDD